MRPNCWIWAHIGFTSFQLPGLCSPGFFSESKLSLLSDCHRDKAVPCDYGLLFSFHLVNEKSPSFDSSQNKIGYRGAPATVVAAQRFRFCSVSAKHALFSVKSTAAVFSLLPSVRTPVWSLLLWGGRLSTQFVTWGFSCLLVSLKMNFVFLFSVLFALG